MRLSNVLLTIVILALPISAEARQDVPAAGIYIALGDSIPAGVGSSMPTTRSYPGLIGRYLRQYFESPVIVENVSQPGETAESFLSGDQYEQFVAAVENARRSDVDILAVTLTFGGNEILQQANQSDAEREAALLAFESDLEQLLPLVQGTLDPDTRLVITTIYDPTGTAPQLQDSDGWWISRFNEVIRSTAASAGVLVSDVAAELGRTAGPLTRYPVDPHPTNAGHEAISRIVWSDLGFDKDPPLIDMISPAQATRSTPTVRFRLSEPAAPGTVVVRAPDSTHVFPPLEVSANEYVVLLRASGADPGEMTLVVEAQDMAGNAASTDFSISFQRP